MSRQCCPGSTEDSVVQGGSVWQQQRKGTAAVPKAAAYSSSGEEHSPRRRNGIWRRSLPVNRIPTAAAAAATGTGRHRQAQAQAQAQALAQVQAQAVRSCQVVMSDTQCVCTSYLLTGRAVHLAYTHSTVRSSRGELCPGITKHHTLHAYMHMLHDSASALHLAPFKERNRRREGAGLGIPVTKAAEHATPCKIRHTDTVWISQEHARTHARSLACSLAHPLAPLPQV